MNIGFIRPREIVSRARTSAGVVAAVCTHPHTLGEQKPCGTAGYWAGGFVLWYGTCLPGLFSLAVWGRNEHIPSLQSCWHPIAPLLLLRALCCELVLAPSPWSAAKRQLGQWRAGSFWPSLFVVGVKCDQEVFGVWILALSFMFSHGMLKGVGFQERLVKCNRIFGDALFNELKICHVEMRAACRLFLFWRLTKPEIH